MITKDGNWLCVLTTGQGREGAGGQHVISTITKDHGRTWSAGRYRACQRSRRLLGGSAGDARRTRVYAFYTYNGDHVLGPPGGKAKRVDMLGWYVYKFSDDNGQSWSAQRQRLPTPPSRIFCALPQPFSRRTRRTKSQPSSTLKHSRSSQSARRQKAVRARSAGTRPPRSLPQANFSPPTRSAILVTAAARCGLTAKPTSPSLCSATAPGRTGRNSLNRELKPCAQPSTMPFARHSKTPDLGRILDDFSQI